MMSEDSETCAVLETPDGQQLEALARVPQRAEIAVVLCHPHPLYGGTMHNELIARLCTTIGQTTGQRIATVRFNFRGVQRSTGSYENGDGEVLDVLTAVDAVRAQLPEASVQIVGYSFGSWVGLRAAWHHPDVQRISLIAPATRIFSYRERREEAHGVCRKSLISQVIAGDRDLFASEHDVRDLAGYLGSYVEFVSGADHFFSGHVHRVVGSVLEFITGSKEARSCENA